MILYLIGQLIDGELFKGLAMTRSSMMGLRVRHWFLLVFALLNWFCVQIGQIFQHTGTDCKCSRPLFIVGTKFEVKQCPNGVYVQRGAATSPGEVGIFLMFCRRALRLSHRGMQGFMHFTVMRSLQGRAKIVLHMGKWIAITFMISLLASKVWFYPERQAVVQWQVQPHVLDRWCVGFVICALCLFLRGRVKKWFTRCFASIAIRDVTSVSSGKKFRYVDGSSPTCRHPYRQFRFVQILIMLTFLHSGEAQNPGPNKGSCQDMDRTWSLGAFNPSGLGGKHQVIGSYLGGCDLWAVSETHLTSRGFASFRQNLKWSSEFQFCVGGEPVPLRSHSDRTGEWSGVCMLSKHPTRQVPVKWPQCTSETSRVLLTTTLCADLWITGAVLYGEPPGISHPDAHANTDMLAHDLFQQLMPIGGLRFFAGDFNFEKGGLEIFQTLEAAGFRDLQDLAFTRWGYRVQKTCKQSTRKDFCFISPELQTFLVDVRIDQTVWADHATIQGLFRGGSNNLITHHWRVPAKVDWPKDFHCNLPKDWYGNPDSDSAYVDLWKHVEHSASIHFIQEGRLPLPQKCKGRGQTMEVTQRRAPFRSGPLRPGRKGDVQPTFIGVSQ